MGEFETFEPAIATAARGAVATARRDGAVMRLGSDAFNQATNISLDYAVMERTKLAAVAPAGFDWSDLGAWDAIWEASVRDVEGNAASGDIHLIQTKNVLARSSGPFVGAIGVEDLLIIAEPDAVLVCRRDDAQAVKTLVDVLKAGGRDIAHRHAIAFSGGVERQPVTSTAGAVVQLWRLEAGATAELPVGSIQVLDGALIAGVQTFEAGSRQELASPISVTAGLAASVLVTIWR
jgi:mannose-1-phosphate guanylyltransferase